MMPFDSYKCQCATQLVVCKKILFKAKKNINKNLKTKKLEM